VAIEVPYMVTCDGSQRGSGILRDLQTIMHIYQAVRMIFGIVGISIHAVGLLLRT
jgi:hypothetical protein